jgi:hypothetical protein
MSKPVQAAISLTPAEQNTVDAWLDRRKRASPRIKLNGKRGNVTSVGTDHSDPAVGFALLMEAVGTKDETFLAGLMEHLVNAGAKGQEVGEAGEAKAKRSGRWPWRTTRRRPSSVRSSVWLSRKAATSASTAWASRARAPGRVAKKT